MYIVQKKSSIPSGERQYACEVCNKALSQKSSLITHQRIHSGEHAFTCV